MFLTFFRSCVFSAAALTVHSAVNRPANQRATALGAVQNHVQEANALGAQAQFQGATTLGASQEQVTLGSLLKHINVKNPVIQGAKALGATQKREPAIQGANALGATREQGPAIQGAMALISVKKPVIQGAKALGATQKREPAIQGAKALKAPKQKKRGQFAHLRRGDRCGAALTNMVHGKAIAKMWDLDYIGVYPATGTESKNPELVKMLGLPKPMEKLPKGTITVQNLGQFVNAVKKKPSGIFFVNVQNLKGDLHLTKPYKTMSPFNVAFRKVLKSNAHFQLPTLWSKEAPLRVAVHIRRGDVVAQNLESRLLPNSWYLDLMDRITKVVPKAEFVIFSSSPFGSEKGYKIEDFTSRPYLTMKLETSIPEAWSHMAQADVLVTSQSSFSKLPALFNLGMVVTEDAKVYHGIVDWVKTEGTMEDLHSALFTGTFDRRLKMAVSVRAQVR